LDDVIEAPEKEKFFNAITEQVNAILPGYDFKMLEVDPDNHFGDGMIFFMMFFLCRDVGASLS